MRVAAAQLGYAGMGAIALAGYGMGVTDTDVLQPGQVITFGVHGTFPCSGIWESDIRDTLNNWAGEMMQINSVETSALGEVPSVVDVTVNATVKKQITAGALRGQIVAALAALSNTKFYTTCLSGVSLVNNVINVASGGTHAGNTCDPGYSFKNGTCVKDDDGIPWEKIALYAGLGLAGTVVLLLVIRK